MTEGTKSYLIGCHQFLLHPLFVLIAWRLEYKSWPKWWGIIGIFLHDCGICGRQYLSDDEAKIGHWKLGASLAWKLCHVVDILRGCKHRDWNNTAFLAWRLVVGHSPYESGFPKSKLWLPDKRSWLIAPTLWLWWNYWVERSGSGIRITKPSLWKKIVAENLKNENLIGSHDLYIKNKGRNV